MIGESRTAVKCYNRRVSDRFLVTGGAGVIDCHLLAARVASVGGEVFNVGCGERVSLLEIIAKLETILGRRLTREHRPLRQGDVQHTLADVSKAKRLLGYSPLVPFNEGLQRTVDYFKTVAR